MAPVLSVFHVEQKTWPPFAASRQFAFRSRMGLAPQETHACSGGAAGDERGGGRWQASAGVYGAVLGLALGVECLRAM
jgi:hypothetical protein